MAIWREVTFAIEAQRAKELVIEDNRACVILDPLRWRILEILEAGKSVTEISEALDVTDARGTTGTRGTASHGRPVGRQVRILRRVHAH